MKKEIILLLIPLLLFSQNYVLKKDVLSSGGRKMTSADYILQGTISQAAIGSVTDTDYQGVIGFWHPPEAFPPIAPYINPVEKSGNDVKLTWNMITTDTLGNPETVHYYVVYRSTSPSFILGPSDSIGANIQPDTVFTDVGALSSGNSYYYLVKAVDIARNRSIRSNMGYKLIKTVVENASATDKNWVSLPWHSNYTTVSDLTTDLSSAGDPLVKVTNLRNDQLYENYTWTTVPFPHWAGTNFTVDPGRGYETVTINDTTLLLVGSNNPNGLVDLTYNASATDKNWVSIPYNAVYSTVSDITTEYSAAGDPLIKITNLRDDQLYENYTWTTVPFPHWAGTNLRNDQLYENYTWTTVPFPHWAGTNFTIEQGRGYEFVVGVTHDTVWDPTEYTNSAKDMLAIGKHKHLDLEVSLGTKSKPDRVPAWSVEDITSNALIPNKEKETHYCDPEKYKPLKSKVKTNVAYREVGISHVVHTYFELEECSNIVFTAYRLNNPFDVLTERIIGCGVERCGRFGALWFDVGNFLQPWQDSEEIILIIEAAKQDGNYFKVLKFELDQGLDIQELGKVELIPIPDPNKKGSFIAVRRREPANQDIIGYSVYKDGQRMNMKIKTEDEYSGDNVDLRLVIRGGYETVYGSLGIQGSPLINDPIAYTFNIYPNPFVQNTSVNYAVPHPTIVNISIYDVCGRKVKSLVSEKTEAGFYKINWYGDDDLSRKAAAGIYFIHIKTDDYNAHRKIILLR